MNWTAQDKVRAGFWLLPFIPAVLCLLAIRTTAHLIGSAEDVAHTNEVEKKLESLFSNLKDIEVYEREYILTGDERLLKRYYAHKPDVNAQFADLKAATADNQSQREQIALLEPIIPQKFQEMEKAIHLRQTEGLEAASQSLRLEAGTRAMDDIRIVTDHMKTQEEQSLRERMGDLTKGFLRTMIIFGALIVVNIGLVWAVWFAMQREEKERQREEVRIRELNAELERRVEQRTEALQRSNEDLQQFAYIASHDLQEPLRMVASYTELLQRRYKGKLDADADQFIEYAIDGVKRMNNLIRDLLAYSRAGHSAEEHLVPVTTEEVLATALQNLRASIGEVNAEVTHDPLPVVQYDPIRLTQVFQNLIGNALKYRGDQTPHIHVSSKTRGSEVIFFVKDNGIGIDPKYHSQIFGIFKRLHGREYEGTGIGLAMCKKIIERHGGRIWVESIVGSGSTFYFSIPNQTIVRAATG
jgi:signal transduction histidine kinase